MAGQAQVSVVMGSDSDWPVMEGAVTALTEFGVPWEADVVSAHRMPKEMIVYGASAAERGIQVIIAGAGGAAHLPGMLSIVQMPAGVPVATVAIGAARNAGLLAVRILAATDPNLRARMTAFQDQLRATAQEKGARLRAQLGAQPGDPA